MERLRLATLTGKDGAKPARRHTPRTFRHPTWPARASIFSAAPVSGRRFPDLRPPCRMTRWSPLN